VPEDELNPKGNTGSFIYDSFLGRELHPRIGKYFDWKLYLYRPSMAGWVRLNPYFPKRHIFSLVAGFPRGIESIEKPHEL